MFLPSISPLAVRATSITPDNKSTAITIATWLLMIIFIILFFMREAIKFVVLRKFALDDLFILLAVIFAIGFSVTSLTLASDGLGVLGKLTTQRANAIMKGHYASDFLYIISIGFVKLSLVTFFHSIVVQRTQRRVVQGLGIFILAWTLASLLAVAFQCGLPRPWEMLTLHCYNSGVFWIVYCIIDMTTEVSLIMLSVNLVAYLKVKFSRKAVVVACFAPRILVIGAALARLIYLFPITPHDNPEFNLWIPIICAEVQISVSICTACIPYMKPFFEGTEGRVWRENDRRSKCLKVNNLCGYQSISGYAKANKPGKDLYSIDSTASTSLKYGRTPDVSPRIPSPVPLSPMTPPRYSTPPNSNSSTSRSPSERGLRLHIPPPDIMIRRATDSTSPQTASSHALSPECLSPDNLLSPSRFSPGGSTLTASPSPSPPLRSHSPRPLHSKPTANSPDTNTNIMTPPRTSTFSLFPRTTSSQYSLISPLTPKYSPPIPPIPNPRSRSDSKPRRISSHRMAANKSQRRSTLSQTSTLPLTLRSIKRESVVPAGVNTSSTSTPSISSYYFHSPPTSNPPNFSPTNAPPLLSSPPSPQRLRNYRVLVPQNSHRREQMSPISPASVSPKTTLTFWRDDSSSGGEGLSAGASAESGTERWKAERPWEREPMPIIRRVGMGSPMVVPSRAP